MWQPPRPDPACPPLLIVGASARAAAWSACRGGWRPVGVDRFGDTDLAAVAETLPSTDWPDDLATLGASAPPGPWLYTGGIENRPELVAAISESRRLWGNPPEVLALARDPWVLHDRLVAAGLAVPALRAISDPPPRDGGWVRRPLRGGGGTGIETWDDRTATHPGLDDDTHVFQQHITGVPLSAVFLAVGGRARLVGVTRQLVGLDWLAAGRFAYCGSIGPLPPDSSRDRELQELGDVLVERCGLVGLFGCDLVNSGGRPWLIELNPRYTASVELFEMSGGTPLLPDHAAACGADVEPAVPDTGPNPSSAGMSIAGKAVLYAARNLVVPTPPGLAPPAGSPGMLADIPAPGTSIARGQPVCSILVAAGDIASCRGRLKRGAAEVYRQLGQGISGGC